ncbi:hypothetical protein EPO04_00325 [Patescibacteria group bacterium]|nr:MAG: hypothetical protein EPO04_00325 [Patescibacteria group bacterium]
MTEAVTISVEDLELLIRRAETHPAQFPEGGEEALNRAKDAIRVAKEHPEQEVSILSPPEVTEFHPREEELKAFFAHPACREVIKDFLRFAVLSTLSPIVDTMDFSHIDIVTFAKWIVDNDEWYTGLLTNWHIE